GFSFSQNRDMGRDAKVFSLVQIRRLPRMIALMKEKQRLKKPNRALAQARKARHWTQKQVAVKLAVGEDTVRNWESGKSVPRPNTRPQLCELFSMSLEELGMVKTTTEVLHMA